MFNQDQDYSSLFAYKSQIIPVRYIKIMEAINRHLFFCYVFCTFNRITVLLIKNQTSLQVTSRFTFNNYCHVFIVSLIFFLIFAIVLHIFVVF